METKNKWQLMLIKYCLDIYWYLNFIFTGITLFTLLKGASFRVNHLFAVPVQFMGTTLERYYPTYTVNGASITMQAHTGAMLVTTPNPFAEVPMILNFIIHSLLFIAILYNLRKLFGTFYRNESFQYENITRLKKIALYTALFSPLYLINCVINYMVLRSFTQKFSIDWRMPILNYLGIAAIIYITAEIFQYGFELKKENEEFI